MDHHVEDYFQPFSPNSLKGSFHKVLALHKSPLHEWEALIKEVPDLPKGWVELAHLPSQDRIEFMREYWLMKLPYHPLFCEFLMKFFNTLEDIGVYVTQAKHDEPLEACLVYSLKNKGGFYRGAPPASEPTIGQLKAEFSDCLFPEDYLAFLQIHNGFWKSTDCTGLTKSTQLKANYLHFQDALSFLEDSVTSLGLPVNPYALIPFYESFGMPFYQCFWSEWYPQNEMGNVYYSGPQHTISDVRAKDSMTETMAFPTFLDWLQFYLEVID